MFLCLNGCIDLCIFLYLIFRCGFCKDIVFIFFKFSIEYLVGVVFLKVDVDKCKVSKLV